MADAQLPEDPIVRLEQVRRQRQEQPKADSPPEFSDDALALGFTDEHRDKLRHVAVWGKWLLWRGSHWQADDTLRVFDLARAKCRDVGAAVVQSHSEKLSAAIASAKTVAAVVSLARSDRRLAETVDAWDRDQGRLNVPEGTADLNSDPRTPQ
jgi:putative DNA primase/helicase